MFRNKYRYRYKYKYNTNTWEGCCCFIQLLRVKVSVLFHLLAREMPAGSQEFGSTADLGLASFPLCFLLSETTIRIIFLSVFPFKWHSPTTLVLLSLPYANCHTATILWSQHISAADQHLASYSTLLSFLSHAENYLQLQLFRYTWKIHAFMSFHNNLNITF